MTRRDFIGAAVAAAPARGAVTQARLLVPFLSVNTCVHELLHALLQDVFVDRPKWYQGGEREFRTDWSATCLWLFHDGAAIRKSGRAYVDRLRAAGSAVKWRLTENIG